MFIDNGEHNDDLKILFNYNNIEELQVLKDYAMTREENLKNMLEYFEEAKIASMVPVKVDHCPHSHGIVIKSKNGTQKYVLTF